SNSYKVAKNTTDKVLMKQCLIQDSVSTPKFIKTNKRNVIIPQDFSYPLIIKPADRSGSRGVTKVEKSDNVKNAIDTALNISINKKVVIEEFIEGQEVSVEAISWKGQHYILTITDKVTSGPPNFVELEHHQPANLNY